MSAEGATPLREPAVVLDVTVTEAGFTRTASEGEQCQVFLNVADDLGDQLGGVEHASTGLHEAALVLRLNVDGEGFDHVVLGRSRRLVGTSIDFEPQVEEVIRRAREALRVLAEGMARIAQ